MEEDKASALRDMRAGRRALSQQMAADRAATANLLADGLATLEKGRALLAWFTRAQRLGLG
jgi:hypothetical protein